VLLAVGQVKAVDTYVEPTGSGGFGTSTPPPAGTQEFAHDSFGFGAYYWDKPGQAGRTIAAAGPLIDLSGTLGQKQIQPILWSNGTNGGGDVDLFPVNNTNPDLFFAFTGRPSTSSTPNATLLTLFASDGTAVAAALGGVQCKGNISTIFGAAPTNPNDPAIMNPTTVPGLTTGTYYLGVSNYNSTNGQGQPMNNAGQNLFNLIPGQVVLPNALGDIKLSTDPLKAWGLVSTDTGTIGSFDPTTGTGDGDQLLGVTGFTSGSSSYIDLRLVPEPTSLAAIGIAGLSMLARRRRS
jgi:hypothetical protein